MTWQNRFGRLSAFLVPTAAVLDLSEHRRLPRQPSRDHIGLYTPMPARVLDLTSAEAQSTSTAFAKLNFEGTAAMSDDLGAMIGYALQDTAEWRYRKAKEFPNDDRNLKAAKELGASPSRSPSWKARKSTRKSAWRKTASMP